MRVERAFPGSTQSIVRARRFAAETLVGIDRELAESIMVMVSELVTNSVRHAAGEFTLVIEHDDHRVRVAVSDEGEQRPSLRNPSPTEPSGRGLQIVNALSDDWGFTETPGRSGKSVWFVVALRPENQGAQGDASAEPRVLAPRPNTASGDSPQIARAARSKSVSRRRQESRTRRRAVCRV